MAEFCYLMLTAGRHNSVGDAASGTVTCLSCVPRLSVIANKTTLRLSDHCPDVSVCHVNSSYTIHCTPHCSSHVSPNKMHDCSYGWLLPPQLVSVFWCKGLHWMQYEVSFGTDIARYHLKYQVFPAWRTWENISVYKWPQNGTYLTFRYFSTFFQIFCIYVPYFVTIWFYFHSIPIERFSFFFCYSASWFIYGQIYILCFIQCRKVDLMQWRTVVNRTVSIWIIT